jgi:hypothetical protein
MAFIKISRRTDILALTAFLLSLSGVVFQGFMFLRGAKVTLYPPQQVLIFADTPSQGTEDRVRVNARMTYVNTGYIGHNAVVRREGVTFRIGAENFAQGWESFTVPVTKGETLSWDKQDEAHPVPVNAGSAASHQTSFAPHPIRGVTGNRKFKYYLSWEEFIKKIKQKDHLEFIWVAEIAGTSKSRRATCRIELDDHFKIHLGHKRWGTAICWPE